MRIFHQVPLIPQETAVACWAAGIAMLLSWRHRTRVDPASLRYGYRMPEGTGTTPRHWDEMRYTTFGLVDGDTHMILKRWGLVTDPHQTLSPEGLFRLLERRGPLWVAGRSAQGPAMTHIRVVTGLDGDGRADTTILHINDPWQRGMVQFDRRSNTGSIYTETVREFQLAQRRAIDADLRELRRLALCYIAYLR